MPPRKAQVVENPTFKLLVIVNACLCVATLATMVAIATTATDPMSKAQDRLFNACESIFTMTAGAFIALPHLTGPSMRRGRRHPSAGDVLRVGAYLLAGCALASQGGVYGFMLSKFQSQSFAPAGLSQP